MSLKILVVDDEERDLSTIKLNLADEKNLELHTTRYPIEAIRLVRSNPNAFAVILLDHGMPGTDGATVAREMFSINPNLLIAIHSGDYRRETLKEYFDIGVADFIEKDMSPSEFRERIRALCRKFEETAQLFEPEFERIENNDIIDSTGMIGRSAGAAEVAKLIHAAAPSSCNVVIHGESGTGKELVARAIHNLSPRRLKPFVAINVAAIAENLVESDLFGHDRGAFTGADRAKIGKLKLADGGTVFLDEIGDMKLDLQAKLLRVLQEGEINPLGSVRTEQINIRVLAASHVDLEKAVSEGRFRVDLYYRLNVLKISIPPLRDRPEDIRPLVAHFQKQFGGEHKVLLMKTIRYLERYPWRGNVRELENEMERLMTVVPSRRIEPSHLSSKFFQEHAIQGSSAFDCSYADFMKRLRVMEKDYLLANMGKGGSLRQAVKLRMKAPIGTIYGRMKLLGIKEGMNHVEIS